MLLENSVSLAKGGTVAGCVAGSSCGSGSSTSSTGERCRIVQWQEKHAVGSVAEQCCGSSISRRSIASEPCNDVLYALTAPQSSTRALCGSSSVYVCDLFELFSLPSKSLNWSHCSNCSNCSNCSKYSSCSS